MTCQPLHPESRPIGTGSWSADEDALLRRDWPAGESASEIARQLPGRSRNAVIGRAHRLGLAKVQRQKPSAPTKLARPPQAPKVKPDARPKPPKPGPQGKVAVVLGVNFPPCSPEHSDKMRAEAREKNRARAGVFDLPANDNTVLLIQRGHFQCAWPVGTPDRPANQMCCGARVPETALKGVDAYCDPHARIAMSNVVSRKPNTANELMRSLRRHIG